jgi:protein-tyrosine phosphatase
MRTWCLMDRLWLGSEPDPTQPLPQHFDVLVLCAEEFQPSKMLANAETRIVRCPIADSLLYPKEETLALSTARIVAEAIDHGSSVLSTCHMGKNRSALIAALALLMLTPMDGVEVIWFIRSRRGAEALANQRFQEAIRNFGEAKKGKLAGFTSSLSK